MSFFDDSPKRTFESGPEGTSQRSTPPAPSLKDVIEAKIAEFVNGPTGDKIEAWAVKIDKMPKEKRDLVIAQFTALLITLGNRRTTRKALRNLGLTKQEAKAVTSIVGGLSYIAASNVFIAKKNRETLNEKTDAA